MGVHFYTPVKLGVCLPLTDAKVKSLKPRDKPYKVSDFDGLYALVNTSGTKLWRFKYRYQGKEKLLSFGKYPYTTLQNARNQRDVARAQLACDIDPAAERKKDKGVELAKSDHTFAGFVTLTEPAVLFLQLNS